MEFQTKETNTLTELSHFIKHITHPLENEQNLDPLMDLIGDAKYVLLGESTHGTHEFYTWRAQISKRLISEKNFSFIAVEGDWPDCYRVNRYVKSYPHSGKEAKEVLQAFNRWPTWMWANWEMVAFAEWLKKHNSELSMSRRVGFYGLDVYSLWESVEAIKHYLKQNDKTSMEVLQQVIDCFEPFGGREGSSYAHATQVLTYSCEAEVINLLNEIRKKMESYPSDRESVFSTEQNALVAVNAEHYYRTMLKGDAASWNIRDRHMMDTLNRLINFHGDKAKAIVWEHNTHIGDARATDMWRQGMVNVGQLAKEQHEKDGVVRIGFGTYKGKLLAGRKWGGKLKIMELPEAKEESLEAVLHESGAKNKILISSQMRKHSFFRRPSDHRAVGVVYQAEHERTGNYVPSKIAERYEAFVHIDETTALHPLHVLPDAHQTPETYPFGF